MRGPKKAGRSVAVDADRTGHIYEGPLVPDVYVVAGDIESVGDDPTVQRALMWLKAE